MPPKYRFQIYRELHQHLPAIYAEARKFVDEIGIPPELKGKIGLTGAVSSCHALLTREVSQAIESASRKVVENKFLIEEIREIVKDVYGDDFDAAPTNTCEAALWVSFDALAEVTVLSGYLGADLTKINIVYGSICGGTDPARLTVDGVDAMRTAARYHMPFDIPTNEELAGVPPRKAFAGMLIMAQLGRRLGAQPILKPLLCHGPCILVNELMEQNYVDFNFAKIRALQTLADFPIWPGEPIGFMTHTEEKEQSATTTALHVALCGALDVDAVTTASTDEAFSRGPITSAGRVGALRSIEEAMRFFGQTDIAPTARAREWMEAMVTDINETLKSVAEAPSFVEALYAGLLGDKSDGVYPGRAGKNSVQPAASPPVPRIAVRRSRRERTERGVYAASFVRKRC